MYCPICGKQTIEGQKFCMECGSPIGANAPQTTPAEAMAQAATTIAGAAAGGNTQTLNLNIVQRREPSREAIPLPIGKAMTSMILGILSIILPFVGYGSVSGIISGVIALVLSKEPLTYKNTRASSLASVGKVTSIVGIAYSIYVTVASFIFLIVYFIFYAFIMYFYIMMMSGIYY